MRKFFIAVSVAFAAVVSVNAQTGVWTGKLKASGVELALIFNIGEESVTLDVPDQGAKEIPVEVSRDATGSGLQNRDEEMFGHKPSAVIADAFARAGIATLRYDDRGFGESTGDVVFCTTEV